MTNANLLRRAAVVSLSITTVFAQSTKVEVLIQGRSGATMILKISDTQDLMLAGVQCG